MGGGIILTSNEGDDGEDILGLLNRVHKWCSNLIVHTHLVGLPDAIWGHLPILLIRKKIKIIKTPTHGKN